MSLVQAISAPTQIAAALQNASAQTGADFNYLLNTAMRESSMNCSAKSATSSACGLFQFTEQTWLATMKKDGSGLGLGQYADQISRDSHGKYVVADPAARREILALRDDPQVSALMAGAYTNASKDRLEASLGRSVSSGELYVAHFLGAGGATKLISAAEDTPNARADMLFPQAAAANRSIFYTSSGAPKTVGQVYQNLVTKHQGGAELAPRPVLASAGQAEATASLGSLSSALNDETTAAEPSYSAPSTGYGGAAVAATAASISRSPLKLTPGVLAVLNSLDAPAQSERKDAKDDRDNKTKVASRLLPRSGFAYG
ncbi:lytic transglycosylase domain-containing protein [Parvibaculum sedimenti]|uniref:lytic transglycosylase domain-containing protein n=1 Tax=Parvibaculum sedimenti TaxID=2608632 RepID=UPI00163A2684|nr:lytic transglycosylase domain-containing protein [Parvibaculum sedimenti]